MGDFYPAMFLSICWVFALIVLAFVFENGMTTLDSFLILGYPLIVYVILSFAGWLAVGIPFHWAICKWLKPRYIYYTLAGFVVMLVLTILTNIQIGVFLGLPAVLQATIFRYYVFKFE